MKKGERFKDIEKNERLLKEGKPWVSRTDHKYSGSSLTPVAKEARQEYYYMATHFLTNYAFETKLDEVIWAYHVEGISERNIVKILNKVRKKKIYKLKVGNTIRRLELIMKKQNGVVK